MEGIPALVGGVFTAAVDQATAGYQLPLAHLIPAAGRAGFPVLEVPAFAVAEYRARYGNAALTRLLAEQRVRIGQLSCGTGTPADVTAPADAWPQAVRLWERSCRMAVGVGCPSLSVFVPRASTDAGLVTDRLGRLVGIAAGHALGVSVEFHAPALMEQAVQIVQDAQRAGRVGLLVDIAALVLAGRDPLADIAAWPRGTVAWVHLADLLAPPPSGSAAGERPPRVLPGHGRLPLPTILTALRRSGYAGAVSVEVPHHSSTTEAAAAHLSWAAEALTQRGLAHFFTPEGDL